MLGIRLWKKGRVRTAFWLTILSVVLTVSAIIVMATMK